MHKHTCQIKQNVILFGTNFESQNVIIFGTKGVEIKEALTFLKKRKIRQRSRGILNPVLFPYKKYIIKTVNQRKRADMT
jgi:hypothetical protein